MCGIAGYVDFDMGRPEEAILRAMADSLRRRGPDSRGVLANGPCGMAHARLSIIDLAGSAQPMQVRGSRIALVYNGELYNYRELREELRGAGVDFDTKGDTEVLLRWLEREGEKAIPRFDGMFAFAAWDQERKSLLIGRDPLGIKPLFFATPRPGLLVYGSEIKAVLEHPEVSAELDDDSLRQVLRFRAVYGDRTLYRSVRQLNPGTYLRFDREGLRCGTHYNLLEKAESCRAELEGLGCEQLVARGLQLFQNAVRKRLVADVPVGAFLSGGLDSSLVTATMRQLREPGEKVCTFSVGFEDDPNSELPFAERVAQALGTEHTEVRVSTATYIGRFSELTGCRDAPLSEPADIAMAEMSRQARNSVKVVLSGEGADETFAGYPKYQFHNVPWPLRRTIQLVGAERGARFAALLGMDRRRALVATRALAQRSTFARTIHWFTNLDRPDLQLLLPGLGWQVDRWEQTSSPQRAIWEQLACVGTLPTMQSIDCLSWLPCNLLERADRMTMAEGLELRVPFLDKALVPFGLALPNRTKIRGRSSKWIVRQWAASGLPVEIVNRKKWGFRVPLAGWFRGKMRDLLHDYLLRPSGLCGTLGDIARIRSLLDSHLNGSSDSSLQLWTLLACEVWYQDVYQARQRASATSGSITGA